MYSSADKTVRHGRILNENNIKLRRKNALHLFNSCIVTEAGLFFKFIFNSKQYSFKHLFIRITILYQNEYRVCVIFCCLRPTQKNENIFKTRFTVC